MILKNPTDFGRYLSCGDQQTIAIVIEILSHFFNELFGRKHAAIFQLAEIAVRNTKFGCETLDTDTSVIPKATENLPESMHLFSVDRVDKVVNPVRVTVIGRGRFSGGSSSYPRRTGETDGRTTSALKPGVVLIAAAERRQDGFELVLGLRHASSKFSGQWRSRPLTPLQTSQLQAPHWPK